MVSDRRESKVENKTRNTEVRNFFNSIGTVDEVGYDMLLTALKVWWNEHGDTFDRKNSAGLQRLEDLCTEIKTSESTEFIKDKLKIAFKNYFANHGEVNLSDLANAYLSEAKGGVELAEDVEIADGLAMEERLRAVSSFFAANKLDALTPSQLGDAVTVYSSQHGIDGVTAGALEQWVSSLKDSEHFQNDFSSFLIRHPEIALDTLAGIIKEIVVANTVGDDDILEVTDDDGAKETEEIRPSSVPPPPPLEAFEEGDSKPSVAGLLPAHKSNVLGLLSAHKPKVRGRKNAIPQNEPPIQLGPVVVGKQEKQPTAPIKEAQSKGESFENQLVFFDEGLDEVQKDYFTVVYQYAGSHPGEITGKILERLNKRLCRIKELGVKFGKNAMEMDRVYRKTIIELAASENVAKPEQLLQLLDAVPAVMPEKAHKVWRSLEEALKQYEQKNNFSISKEQHDKLWERYLRIQQVGNRLQKSDKDILAAVKRLTESFIAELGVVDAKKEKVNKREAAADQPEQQAVPAPAKREPTSAAKPVSPKEAAPPNKVAPVVVPQPTATYSSGTWGAATSSTGIPIVGNASFSSSQFEHRVTEESAPAAPKMEASAAQPEVKAFDAAKWLQKHLYEATILETAMHRFISQGKVREIFIDKSIDLQPLQQGNVAANLSAIPLWRQFTPEQQQAFIEKFKVFPVEAVQPAEESKSTEQPPASEAGPAAAQTPKPEGAPQPDTTSPPAPEVGVPKNENSGGKKATASTNENTESSDERLVRESMELYNEVADTWRALANQSKIDHDFSENSKKILDVLSKQIDSLQSPEQFQPSVLQRTKVKLEDIRWRLLGINKLETDARIKKLAGIIQDKWTMLNKMYPMVDWQKLEFEHGSEDLKKLVDTMGDARAVYKIYVAKNAQYIKEINKEMNEQRAKGQKVVNTGYVGASLGVYNELEMLNKETDYFIKEIEKNYNIPLSTRIKHFIFGKK